MKFWLSVVGETAVSYQDNRISRQWLVVDCLNARRMNQRRIRVWYSESTPNARMAFVGVEYAANRGLSQMARMTRILSGCSLAIFSGIHGSFTERFFVIGVTRVHGVG